MGCGGSKAGGLDIDNSVTQAIVAHEHKRQRERELGQQQQQREQAAPRPSATKKYTTPVSNYEYSHNIEPARGFNHLTLYNPNLQVDPTKDRERALQLAKRASAANLTDEKPSNDTKKQETQKTRGAHHLRNVFAKPFTEADVSSFQAPVFKKSSSDRTFLADAVKKNFVFTNLSERQMDTLLDAFEKVEYHARQQVIRQGEDGDYFFVVRVGTLHFDVDATPVGTIHAGNSFGELALLYESPRAASVVCDTACTLFRVDQSTFRYIMQTQKEQTEQDKRRLLQGIPFLKDLDETDIEKLADAMVPRRFQVGEVLAQKGSEMATFFVILEGKVRVTDIDEGQTRYENYDLGSGDYFGEKALVKEEPLAANFAGKTKGMVLTIDKEQFNDVLGDFSQLISKSQDKKRLAAIRLIQNTYLSGATLATLASRIQDVTLNAGSVLMTEGSAQPPALYLVREGQVELKREDGRGYQVVEEGGFFGDDTMTADYNGVRKDTKVPAKFTVAAMGTKTVLGMLTLQECRRYFDTTLIGKGKRTDFTSIVDEDIPLKSLKKHGLLGAGTFGQVWLVTKVAPDGTNRPYALKVQSKIELVKSKQAKGVIRERNIMAQLNSPFIIRLVQTYQDDTFVYMLLGLVQGGELYSVMHTDVHDGIREKDAKFYAAAILEGLSYLHRRQIVYRDLKPENVLIAYGGYPVIVDLGFAKVVENKTYTLCGTPLYLAPEVILNQGHNRGADHWSLGILIFEMITGNTPFYLPGIDQITLYRFVVKGDFSYPRGVVSGKGRNFIDRLLKVDPRKRLGSLAGGIEEIYSQPWFDDIDFGALRRKEIEAPWNPTIKDPLDRSQFDNWQHIKVKSKEDYAKLPQRYVDMFKDF